MIWCPAVFRRRSITLVDGGQAFVAADFPGAPDRPTVDLLHECHARDVVIPALDAFPYEELRCLRFAELVPRDASSTGTTRRRLDGRRRSSQQSPSVAAAAATFVATSPIDRLSPVVNPDRAASRGLTSRRASNVVP